MECSQGQSDLKMSTRMQFAIGLPYLSTRAGWYQRWGTLNASNLLGVAARVTWYQNCERWFCMCARTQCFVVKGFFRVSTSTIFPVAYPVSCTVVSSRIGKGFVLGKVGDWHGTRMCCIGAALLKIVQTYFPPRGERFVIVSVWNQHLSPMFFLMLRPKNLLLRFSLRKKGKL